MVSGAIGSGSADTAVGPMFQSTMKTLIFGGTGHLGRALHALARARGPAYGYGRHHDIVDNGVINTLVDAHKPDLIIHAVQSHNYIEAEYHPGMATALMGISAQTVCRAAEKYDIPVIYVSSDMVFSGEKQHILDARWEPYTEQDITGPINAFGRAKRLGEVMTLRYPKGYIVRLAHLFGPFAYQGTNVVDHIIESALMDDQMVMRDDWVFSMTYNRDAASLILDIVNQPPGIYHGNNEGATTYFGLADFIYTFLSSKGQVKRTSNAEYAVPVPLCAAMTSSRIKNKPMWRNALIRYMNERGLIPPGSERWLSSYGLPAPTSRLD